MSVDRKEIDLIIKAALKNGNTLDSVTKSIRTIESALDDQAAAAKRGENSIDGLKATLEALKKTQEQLKDQASLIGQYDRLSKAITKSEEKVASSSKTFADYKDKIDKAGKATDYQANRLITLANAAERNQTTLAKQRTDQEALAVTLREAGVEMDKLGEAENRVRQSAAQLGIVINKTHDAISTYSEDVRKARSAEVALAEEQAFQKKLSDAANLNKAGEYVRFWTDALNKADVAEAQFKVKEALRQTADEAVASARGYKTLGAATKALAGPSSSLRETIQGILDPAQQARSTLAGVEEEVRKVGNAVSAIKGPISNYRETVQQLVTAQKAIAGQANLVDQFNGQVAAVRQARTEFTAARANVLQYAEALRNSNGQTDQLSASLRSAQSAFTQAKKNLQDQVQSARDMRQAMREAGLATNDLTGVQSRLTSAAQSSVAALNGLKNAHDKYGEASRNSATANGIFESSGRTTLSLMQRIRGEILSMVAAYVGLYGAINTAKGSVEAFNTRQATQNKLAIVVGNDAKDIGNAYQYVSDQADRLGLDFVKTSDAYSKFAAAAKLSGRRLSEINYIFETFAEVGTVFHLSGEDMAGVFKALEQMFSKGKISAEELRQQLGERLPGAFEMFQKALKGKFPDLNKAMEEGKVGIDNVLLAADLYRKTFAEQLPNATKSLVAQQNRLTNELFRFKLAIADSGFITKFTDLIVKLTETLQTAEGKKFAQELANGFGLVVQSMQWVVENAQIVKDVLLLGVFVLGARSAASFAEKLVEVAVKLGMIEAGGLAAAGSVAAISKAFTAVTAFAVGWTIADVLAEKFVGVRKAFIVLATGVNASWALMKFGAEVLWEEVPAIFLDGLATLGNLVTTGVRSMLQVLSSAARAVGKNDLADSVDKAISAIEFKVGRVGRATKNLTAQLSRDLEQIRKMGRDALDEASNPGSTSPAVKRKATTTGNPGPSNDPLKIDEKAAEKRKKLKEQIEAELAAIDAKIEKQEKDSLASRLAAIDDTYFKLIRKIAQLGGSEAKALSTKLQIDVDMLKAQETRKFNEALLKEQTDIQRKLEQIDAQAGRNDKTDLQRRLDAVKGQHEQTYRDIAELRRKLLADNRSTATADLMQQRLDAGVVQLQNLERQKYYEDALNSVLEERKARLDVIAVQEKTGLLTATQARERAAQVVEQTQPKLEAIVAEGLKYVDVMLQAAEATGANTTSLDTLKAKLIEGRESAKGLRTEFLSAAQVNEMLANGATSAFEKMATAIGGAITGMNSWGDAIDATRNAFLNFAADFLMELGKMILKQALLNAMSSAFGDSTGGVGSIIAKGVNALLKHDGGVIGAAGSSTRMVNPSMFFNAPKYHGGGIAGLAPDEYPAILKKNEEVLTQNDPRNVLNGGSAGSAAAQNIKIMNMIDSGSVVSEGLSSQEGERAIFNFMRANRTGLKQILG